MSKKIQAPLDAIGAKVKAFEAGIHFAHDMGISEFILVGDSLIIFNALYDQSPPPSSIAPIVCGILSSVHGFRKVEFSHVSQ